jgi:tRNA pseudouridine synthase 10
MTGTTAKKTREILRKTKICYWCLGRHFTSSQSEIEGVGSMEARRLGLELQDNCELCGDAYSNRAHILKSIIEELSEYEYETFQVGITLSNNSVEKEDEIRSMLRLSSGISLKKGLSGLFRHELAAKTHRKPALRNPDVTVRIGLPEKAVQVESKPMTVYVEYLKLARGIPTRAVPCPSCGGQGCSECEETGIARGDYSVEAALTKSFLESFRGRRVKISWSGIDDEHSQLLGGGRPTYVEVVNPVKRTSGLLNLKMGPSTGIQLNRAEIAPLDRGRIEALLKEVQVTAEFESELTKADVQVLEQAYSNRGLITGDRKERLRTVRSLRVKPSGRWASLTFLVDNGIDIRQILAVRGGVDDGLDWARPSFADLMPFNRVLSIESDVTGFRQADY